MTKASTSRRRRRNAVACHIQQVRAEMQRMLFAPLPHEALWYAEIEKMPTVWVICPDDKALRQGGMKPGECHYNCFSQCREQPAEFRMVHGWMAGEDVGRAMVHTIVQHIPSGEYYDLTPTLRPLGGYQFTPDPELKVPFDGPITRRGIPVGGPAVRKDPEQFIARVHRELKYLDRAARAAA